MEVSLRMLIRCVSLLIFVPNVYALNYKPGIIGEPFFGTTQGGFCQTEGFCFSEAESWQEHENYYKNRVCGAACTLQSRDYIETVVMGASSRSIMAGIADDNQRVADSIKYIYLNIYDEYYEVWCKPANGDPCAYQQSGLVHSYRSYPWGCSGGATFVYGDPNFPGWWGAYCKIGADEVNEDLEKGRVCPANGSNPINTFTGNKFQIETDIVTSRIRSLGYARYYNNPEKISTVFVNNINPTNSGKGWTHSYEYTLEYIESYNSLQTPHVINLFRPTGKKLVFQYTTGPWENVYESDSPEFTLTDTANGWQLTQPNGDVEDYNSEGRITSLTYQHGGNLTFTYDLTVAQGGDDNTETLDHVIDHLGNTIAFTYNSDQKIQTVTDPNGATYSYAYDSEQNLISVQNPDTSTRQYLYENVEYPNHLTGIIDENNHRYATWSYDTEGRAIQSEHAGNVNQVQLDYTYLNDAVDPRVTVTNEFGKDTTYHYQMIGGVRKVTQVEGHATANCAAANQNYTYDVNGFVASKTDWEGNVTTYINNARGLETTRTEASGTSEARTITTEWHATYRLPIKITEPGKETTFNYDSNGLLLSRTEKETP